jgi:hypothetical protein
LLFRVWAENSAQDHVFDCDPLTFPPAKHRRSPQVKPREGAHMPDPLERKEEARLRDLLAAVPALADRELTIEPLGGGLTNRNYLVDADSEAYVVRVAGADTSLLGIDRDREVACAQAAADAGVAPPIVAYLPENTTIRRPAGFTRPAGRLAVA